jgi:hypothetical protein
MSSSNDDDREMHADFGIDLVSLGDPCQLCGPRCRDYRGALTPEPRPRQQILRLLNRETGLLQPDPKASSEQGVLVDYGEWDHSFASFSRARSAA